MTGVESNRGSSAKGPAGGCKKHPGVVHQSAQDEGHLSYSKPVQHRCDPEMPHCWSLVSRCWPWLHPVCPQAWHGEYSSTSRPQVLLALALFAWSCQGRRQNNHWAISHICLFFWKTLCLGRRGVLFLGSSTCVCLATFVLEERLVLAQALPPPAFCAPFPVPLYRHLIAVLFFKGPSCKRSQSEHSSFATSIWNGEQSAFAWNLSNAQNKQGLGPDSRAGSEEKPCLDINS